MRNMVNDKLKGQEEPEDGQCVVKGSILIVDEMEILQKVVVNEQKRHICFWMGSGVTKAPFPRGRPKVSEENSKLRDELERTEKEAAEARAKVAEQEARLKTIHEDT